MNTSAVNKVAAVDLRLLRTAAPFWGVLLALATLGLCAGITGMFVPLLTVLPAMLAMTLFGAVEAAKLTHLFGTLPVSRADVMRAHYLLVLGAAALSWAPWLVSSVVHLLNPRWGTTPGDLLGWTAAVGGVLVALSVMIPCHVKWGANKGLLVLGLLVMVLVGVGAGIGKAVSLPQTELNAVGAVAMLAIGLVALAISLLVTTRIYEHQDH